MLALSACAAPNISPPPQARVQPPAAWRTEAGQVAPIAPDWWRGLGDVELDRLVERALANSPDLGIAAARVREARAQERLSRAQLFPTLDLNATAAHARSLNPFGAPVEGSTAQPVFQAAYELDLFGRVATQVRAARLSAEASEAARDAVRLSVASAVASGYVTLRALDARLAVVRETAAARAEALRIARDRASVGYTSQLELRQAESEYRAATQIVPQAQLAITRQENALSLLLGEAPRGIARGLVLTALHRPGVPEGLPSDLLRRRPDIAQAERALAASDASLAAARAQFLPQVRLTASAGAIASSALGDPVTIWSLGSSILAPLFEGGRLRAGVEGAAARRDQAAFGYQRTVLTAFREVEDNLAASQRIAEQRVELERQRTALADALRHATNRYQAGYSPYLDQLDAQRNLLAAELTLIQLEADQLNAMIALHQAMGGGWIP
jgi:NodT family efflux transporter outer membrane factor (OMF) lipoprotein